ncbi:MAG TPA: hypothetical protein VME43_23460, partial [Bryobacteraceae bacterium]|nr:hypothetical protein [Bryobacteraceae bacterium]
WQGLREAGDAGNMTPILRGLGMSDTEVELAVTEAMTAVWWSEAMASYAAALSRGQSLEAAGKNVVQDSNRGYNEPWLVLAAWNLAGQPSLKAEFVSPLLETALAAH